jgi:ABC-type phosphate/phosphonate transport system substrate-binding protein
LKFLTAGLVALVTAAPCAVWAAPLRIASIGGPQAACRPVETNAPAGERAYYAHLAKRLESEVVKCPLPDRLAAAQALAAGQVDLAVLDPATFEAVKSTVRTFMTVRPADGSSRVPVVLATRSVPKRDLAALKGGALVFGGKVPASYAIPKQALADKGVDAKYFSREIVAADYNDAAAVMRSGKADAMILHASAYRRLCRGSSPKAKPCADLTELWRGRTRALTALAVRRDMPDLLRYRLVGIFLPLHMEAPDAFAWAASWTPKAAQFEPAEADALALAR